SNFMLEPGKSYMYSSGAGENKTLVYSDSRSNMKAETEEPHWQTDRHAYADNLTMIAVVKIEGEEQRDESCEVGAFVNGECRGSAKLMYDAETDRYLAMLTISGEDGDVIDFGVTNGGRQMLGSETRIRFTENAMIGDFTSPKEIMFGEMTDQSITIYPNPVGKDMPISLTLPTDDDVTEIVITDMLGVVVRHETANGKEITGISKPGVYMIRTVCKSGKVYNTRIIVK
ncbi:MAG: T9SS type A sorting domain-containing protein, partial [Bacteroidales bacterium]|nr:T9SS type A sorting domain-containing protein [Bacteroidales bacterium]